ncbi:cytochrome c oxidase assembly protein [Aromatoleum petrolei]|uniref:Cytochrome c oxidase assembly protein CtaG n=1 Tax=Aromatoleum petrolei TaxID=76116 RepID=A0ABX1ML38_9RHOO|nr:cytochrome c oxidase assembly protein [Aromatoleum petrolei]NMF87406.1 cytochrome c oxidase assembly protein [Aromatoleum petrolei]QTQ35773.1 Cytochrome c oxidase assembly protein [Aromatoleum petrolei]
MSAATRIAAENRRLLVRLAVAAVVMFGFGFLLVPFYEKICEVTGINNLLKPDSVANTQIDLTRTVTVQFDANTHDLPWQFRPLQTQISIHPGELATVAYEVSNTRSEPVTGQAVPSYGPQLAGQYFRKLECFCFAKQTLAAGEKRTMPVAFVVDPGLPADVKVITLSYTFFEIAGRRIAGDGAGDRS